MEFHPLRFLLGVVLAFFVPNIASAQLTLNVSTPSSSVQVSNNIPYTITVTGQGQVFSGVQVSSTYSPSLDFVSASPQDGNVSFTRQNNTAQFVIQQLIPNSNQVLNLTLRPRLVTTVTNLFTATIGQFTVTRSVTNTVTEIPGTADVAVTITPPPQQQQPIIVNDWVTFGVSLTNRGGGTVSGIFLTNTFTNGPVLIKGFRPSTGGSVVQNPTRVIFNVGSLAAGRATNYQITVQPTAATNLILRSNFRSTGNADTNAANNIDIETINVQRPGTNLFDVGIVSTPQQFNPQNAFMEQRIGVTNVGPTEALSARVMFSNITYRVANAVGTNNSRPFVVHPATIQPGERVEMLIEYFIPSREPRPDPDLIAYSIGDVTPTASRNGSGVEITDIQWRQPFGAMTESNLVLQFQAVPNAAYEVQYSSSPDFTTNALRALPLLIAPANRVMWVDYGPPKTVSRPTLDPPTISTNFVTNSVLVTNVFYVTNGMTIETNSIETNIVTVTANPITNSNMRFYRAVQLLP